MFWLPTDLYSRTDNKSIVTEPRLYHEALYDRFFPEKAVGSLA
jgi:hypothetical protein